MWVRWWSSPSVIGVLDKPRGWTCIVVWWKCGASSVMKTLAPGMSAIWMNRALSIRIVVVAARAFVLIIVGIKIGRLITIEIRASSEVLIVGRTETIGGIEVCMIGGSFLLGEVIDQILRSA